MADGYLTVTELPGNGATAEQLAMLYTRYHVAAGLARGREVLEVACGPGMGLGYLVARAKRVTGGDYDGRLLELGKAHYGPRVPLVRLDAQALPFRDAVFDLVILFEAIYYLGQAERFVREARRVLRGDGVVLLCSANKERPGFQPSPFSVSYFSASEFRKLLTQEGFGVEVYGAFPIAPSLPRNSRKAARWLADTLQLSPRTKAHLKGLLFGKPIPFPAEVTEAMTDAAPLAPLLDDSAASNFQVVFAIGRLR